MILMTFSAKWFSALFPSCFVKERWKGRSSLLYVYRSSASFFTVESMFTMFMGLCIEFSSIWFSALFIMRCLRKLKFSIVVHYWMFTVTFFYLQLRDVYEVYGLCVEFIFSDFFHYISTLESEIWYIHVGT